MTTDRPTYRYLNLEEGWPGFRLSGLAIGDDGALTLAPLPRPDQEVTEPFPPLPGFDGPAGVGVDDCGNLYIADPGRHRILRVDACEGEARPLACLRGPGQGPGELLTPRGVAAGPRAELYIADSGNGRIQVIDLRTEQLVGLWEAGTTTPPLVNPWDVAVDRAGAVYIADPGRLDPVRGWQGGLVHKVSRSGTAVVEFAKIMRLQPERPGAPVSVAVVAGRSGARPDDRLLVLDRQPPRLLVYELDGTLDREATRRWEGLLASGASPNALTAAHGRVYLADAASRRVYAFDDRGRFQGAVRGPDQPAAGVAMDCSGRLVVNPGGGGAVRRSRGLPEFADCGMFLAGPLDGGGPTEWQRLELEMPPPPPGTHLKLYFLTTDTRTDATEVVLPVDCGGTVSPPPEPPTNGARTALDTWRAAPWDVSDTLILAEPGRYLWIAGQLQGDGAATPVIGQMKLHYADDGWRPHMPAIYFREPESAELVRRVLALLESAFGTVDGGLGSVPGKLDAWAAPDGDSRPAWLDWLAGVVDAWLQEAWPGHDRRTVVAEAFRRHARRGTRESLAWLVARHAGAPPIINDWGSDPLAWSLGASARLGAGTMLPPAAADGAVLGASATVDRSALTSAEAFGEPLAITRAHRFTVRVHRGLLGTDGLARVREVLEREKPAHTEYHLCPIEPRLLVGHQARVGIDAIVGGPPAPQPLTGGDAPLGAATVLPGLAPSQAGRRRLDTGQRTDRGARLA